MLPQPYALLPVQEYHSISKDETQYPSGSEYHLDPFDGRLSSKAIKFVFAFLVLCSDHRILRGAAKQRIESEEEARELWHGSAATDPSAERLSGQHVAHR